MSPVAGLMLLDTPALYYRAFYGIPDSITADDGTPVNAVRGLLDMIASLVREHRPDRLVSCMDADWRPAFRVAALPSYKAHRLGPDGAAEDTPPGLVPQVPLITEVLDAAGIAQARAAGYEADDVIATLAQTGDGPEAGGTDIVTGDRDLFQLVDDARGIRVQYTARGVRNLTLIDEAAVTAKYDIPGRAYADFATLRGDPSDGLPGVPGVGAKTAAAVITRFGGLDAMLAALDAGEQAGFPAGARNKLKASRAYLDNARTVVQVVTDVKLPGIDDRLPAAPHDPARLDDLAARWNLGGPVERLLDALRER
jgi:5'-3' exonuclease